MRPESGKRKDEQRCAKAEQGEERSPPKGTLKAGVVGLRGTTGVAST